MRNLKDFYANDWFKFVSIPLLNYNLFFLFCLGIYLKPLIELLKDPRYQYIFLDMLRIQI